MARKSTTLTDSAIKVAKSRERAYKLSDGQGMYLEVMPTGSKLWRMKYRFEGKESRISFGAYPTVTLQQARQRRTEAREQLAQGINPTAERRAVQEEQRQSGTTFAALAEEWFAYNAPRWAESTRAKARLYLDKDILPIIGTRIAKDITRPELVELARLVEARGALNVAEKVRRWLSQVFRHGLALGVVEANPATDLVVVAAPQLATRHHPFVPFTELPELLAKIDVVNINTMTRHAIRLLMLTAVRPGELRQAPWTEIDLSTATWTIPKERMKARRPHVVPLPTQAVEILRQLHEISGQYDLLFPGQNNASRPMSENTINKALALMGYKGRQTGHGFRHLLSTELNGRGYNRDWIERQLAHGDNDEIRDTYNHATYLDQRRDMMQKWADSIDALCIGANVVSIKRQA